MNPDESSLLTLTLLGLFYLLNLLIQLFALIYIPKDRKPTAALSWLLFIYIIPIVGLIFFFMIGSTFAPKRRRTEQEKINGILKTYTQELDKKELTKRDSQKYRHIFELGENLTSLAPTGHNKAEILYGYDNLINELVQKISSAEHYVYLEFYIMALDTETTPVFEALKDAVSRGVRVKVLFDAWGSKKYPRYKEMMSFMTKNGIEWHKMLPLRLNPFSKRGYYRFDLRNHRKIVVIDSNDAYIGSLNLVEKRYHRKDDIYYTELMLHMQGPAVNETATVFATDWYLEAGKEPRDFNSQESPLYEDNTTVQVLPSGPNFKHRNNLMVFNSLIHEAKDSIIINNPYLVPDESLRSALVSASLRGVKVSILNSEAIDQRFVAHAQRSYYEEFLKAGIKIYLHKKPELVHDKWMSIDGDISVIGSSNLDIRSFELNQECVVIVEDTEIAKTLQKRHNDLKENSHQLKLSEWRKRSGWNVFMDGIARLTSALQ